MIPSVQVGAGIPLQSTQMSMAQSALPQQSVAQSAVQQNMAPVQAGSILQLPPGSMVPVQAGNSIVYVPTQPIATQQVSVNLNLTPALLIFKKLPNMEILQLLN